MLPIATSTFAAYATTSIGPAIEGFLFSITTLMPYLFVGLLVVVFIGIVARLFRVGK